MSDRPNTPNQSDPSPDDLAAAAERACEYFAGPLSDEQAGMPCGRLDHLPEPALALLADVGRHVGRAGACELGRWMIRVADDESVRRLSNCSPTRAPQEAGEVVLDPSGWPSGELSLALTASGAAATTMRDAPIGEFLRRVDLCVRCAASQRLDQFARGHR